MSCIPIVIQYSILLEMRIHLLHSLPVTGRTKGPALQKRRAFAVSETVET